MHQSSQVGTFSLSDESVEGIRIVLRTASSRCKLCCAGLSHSLYHLAICGDCFLWKGSILEPVGVYCPKIETSIPTKMGRTEKVRKLIEGTFFSL